MLGPNASGKTSLLEAIYVLGHGRSFRTYRVDPLIAANHAYYQVVGELSGCSYQSKSYNSSKSVIGIQRDKKNQIAKIDGEPITSQAALSAAFPVQIIHPRITNLITEGPSVRRKYLDWGVFHVKPAFLQTWRDYNQSLSHRNAALKKQGSAEIIASFDEGLITNAEKIASLREDFFLNFILPVIIKNVASLLPNLPLKFEYYQGWQGAYREKVCQSLQRDLQFKTTHYGPHKADIKITTVGSPANLVLSSGQQKLLAIALILAQIEIVAEIKQQSITLLVDDIAAELDAEKIDLITSHFLQLNCQLWLTGLSNNEWDLGSVEHQMFHVKHGVLKAVN